MMRVKKSMTFVAATIGAIVAFLTSLRWLVRRRETTSWSDANRPGEVVIVDGVGVHYVEKGRRDAPAIVMVHGFGGHTFSFRHQIAAFSSQYRVVAIDLKGFGYTERQAGGDYSLTGQAQLLLGTMDALGIERAVLVGHSMGGEVVMRAAAMAPDRVEKLILVASVPGDRLPTLPRIGFMRPVAMAATRLLSISAWRRMFYDRSKLDLTAIRNAYLAPLRIEGTEDALWDMYADARRDKPIAYKRITAPVLILWAEKERVLPFASRSLKLLRKHFPNAEVVTVPETGHLVLEENPAAANAAIRRFLGAGEAPTPDGETVDTVISRA